jgi:hypothetical protein
VAFFDLPVLAGASHRGSRYPRSNDVKRPAGPLVCFQTAIPSRG